MYSKKEITTIRSGINNEDNENFSEIFKALGEVGRFHIFKLLLKESRPLCVADIAAVLGISSSATSQKLKDLEIADLLIKERDGKEVCYSVNKNNSIVKSIIKYVLSE